MKLINLYLLLLLIFFSCKKQNNTYQPEGLVKLSHSEILTRAKEKDEIDLDKVTFKNEKGEVISLDSVLKIHTNERYTSDRYINNEGEVVELVIREAKEEDRMLYEKLKNIAIDESVDYQKSFEKINCKDKDSILKKVYSSDQGMRNNNNINPAIDRNNLELVINIIEQCGMPVETDQLETVWLVLQHGDNDNRKKYLPLFEESVKQGYLDKKSLAMMKDRILVIDNKPQIYGTQVMKNENGKWVLCEVEEPSKLNERRKLIGFPPIEEYLKSLESHTH